MNTTSEELDVEQISKSFDQEVVDLIKEQVDLVIYPASTYNHAKVAAWVKQICDGVMKKLMELKMPRKYIVNCVIVQRNGAGLHTATSCFWDLDADASCTHKVEFKTMICIVTVYGLQL
eukprot:EG_transcript_42645